MTTFCLRVCRSAFDMKGNIDLLLFLHTYK